MCIFLTLRVIITLDIIFCIIVVGQQIWYTDHLFEILETERGKVNNNDTSLKANAITTAAKKDDGYFSATYIPDRWIIPYMVLVVFIGATSALISIALLITTLDCMKFKVACSMFTKWMCYTLLTVLICVIVGVMGFPIPVIVIHCLIYMTIRLGFTILISDIFINLMLCATAVKGEKFYDGFDGLLSETTTTTNSGEASVDNMEPLKIDGELLTVQTLKQMVIIADDEMSHSPSL